MRIHARLVLVLALLVCGAARADTLHLKSGAKFEGELVEKTATHYVFKVRGLGVQRFKVSDVLRLEEKKGVYDEYAERKNAAAKDDADAQFALGTWCGENGLRKEARAAFEAAIAADPDHAGAREKLGYRRVSRQWLTGKQYKALRKRQEEETAEFLAKHSLWAPEGIHGTDFRFWAPRDWKREDAEGGKGVRFTGPEVAGVAMEFGVELLTGSADACLEETRKALEAAGRRVEDAQESWIGTRKAREFLSVSGGEGEETARLDAFAEGPGGGAHVWLSGPGQYPVILEMLFCDLRDACSFEPRGEKQKFADLPGPGWSRAIEKALSLAKQSLAVLGRANDLDWRRDFEKRQKLMEEHRALDARSDAYRKLRDLGDVVLCPPGDHLAAIAFIRMKKAGMSTLSLADSLPEFFARHPSFKPDAGGPRPRKVSGRRAYATGFRASDGAGGFVALFGKGDLRYAVLAVTFAPQYPEKKLREAFNRVLDRYRFP